MIQKKDKTALRNKIILAYTDRRPQSKISIQHILQIGLPILNPNLCFWQVWPSPSFLSSQGTIVTQGVRCFLISRPLTGIICTQGVRVSSTCLTCQGFLRVPVAYVCAFFDPNLVFVTKKTLFWMCFESVVLLWTNFRLSVQDLNSFVDIKRNDCSWSDHREWVLHFSCRNGQIGSKMSICVL